MGFLKKKRDFLKIRAKELNFELSVYDYENGNRSWGLSGFIYFRKGDFL